MTLKQAESPFHFNSQISQVEPTGLKARHLGELLDHLRAVSDSVVYYHTHHFLKQHQSLSPEPPNDFAYWVNEVLNDTRLGEQLAAIDTIQFPSIQALREKLIAVLERYLARAPLQRTAQPGEEFHFMRSRSFIFPTPYVSSNLAEFVEAVKKISVYSLYHHIFEARLRLKRGKNDFSLWLDKELGEKDLALEISRLDPYTSSLEALRNRILRLCEIRLRALPGEVDHAA